MSAPSTRAPGPYAARDDDASRVDHLRAQTQLVRSGLRHLNNAGASPMPDPVLTSVREYLDLESRLGGYEAADASARAVREAYVQVGKLIGVAPESVAVVENATVAVAQALSSIVLEPGDVILTSRNDYVSNQLMYLSLAQRLGVDVERADDLPSGGIDAESVAARVEQRRPALVAVTHMPTNSGLIQDVEAVGRICREHDIPYLVDACQSVGQMPLDLEQIGCDFLAATARKFLRGPRGIGFLAVSDRVLASRLAPLFIDLHGAEWTGPQTYELARDARRWENWEFNYANLIGMGVAASYARECDLSWIESRVTMLAERARAGLEDIESVRVLDHGARLGAIVSFTVDAAKAEELDWVGKLRERQVNTSSIARSSAIIDLDAKSASWGVRVSPHAFNLESEVDELVEAVGELVAGVRT